MRKAEAGPVDRRTCLAVPRRPGRLLLLPRGAGAEAPPRKGGVLRWA